MEKIPWLCILYGFLSLSAPVWGSAVSIYESALSKTIEITKKDEIISHVRNVLDSIVPKEIEEKMSSYKITLLFSSQKNHEGIFYPPGKHPIVKNEKELVIELNPAILSSRNYLRLITHEVFHAIHFIINPNEVSWVREGLAQYFEYMIHGSMNDRNLLAALKNSTTPLIGEYDINEYDPEQYGHNFLYFYFLIKNCSTSNKDIFWDLAEAKNEEIYTSHLGIDSVLSNISSSKKMCSSFTLSATQFELARVINHYSGMSQKSDTFILSHIEEMDTNISFEQNFSKLSYLEKRNFFKELPSFLPLYLGGEMWTELRPFLNDLIKMGGKVYKLTPYFPYTYEEINFDVLHKDHLSTQNLIIIKTGLK